MGLGKGVHAIFGTQGLADLETISPTFKNQVMNCVNTLLCHRLNDQDSAEDVCNWIGTQEYFNVTAQISGDPLTKGSVGVSRSFIVHPDAIKRELGVGEVVFVSKVGGFELERGRVLVIDDRF